MKAQDTAAKKHNVLAGAMTKFISVLKTFDIDQNGTISLEEFEKAMSQVCAHWLGSKVNVNATFKLLFYYYDYKESWALFYTNLLNYLIDKWWCNPIQ